MCGHLQEANAGNNLDSLKFGFDYLVNDSAERETTG